MADPHVSRRPCLVEVSEEGVTLDISGTRIALEVDGEPVHDTVTIPRERLRQGAVLLLARQVCLLLHESPAIASDAVSPPGMIGCNERMIAVYDEIRRVAGTELAVLIRGESGTGKELVARAIHEASQRNQGPWIAVNVGSLAPTLAAAELFGVRPGAFTGARLARPGLFKHAAGGTIFLDEIGSTDAEIQTMLLRVLEDKIVRPVGSDDGVEIDVRVLAATDSDLEAAVAGGSFRQPLLQRLGTYEIRLPPLRERRDDIGRLLIHFLRRSLDELGTDAIPLEHRRPGWLPARLVAELALHRLPGNVRQLRNIASRIAVRFRDSDRIHGAEVIEWLETSEEPPTSKAGEKSTKEPGKQSQSDLALRRRPVYRDPMGVGDDELVSALEAHEWKILAAAKALNVSRSSMYALIDKSDRVRKAADLGRLEIEQRLGESGNDVRAAARLLMVSSHGLKQRMKELGILPPGHRAR